MGFCCYVNPLPPPQEFMGWSIGKKTGSSVGKKLALKVTLISAQKSANFSHAWDEWGYSLKGVWAGIGELWLTEPGLAPKSGRDICHWSKCTSARWGRRPELLTGEREGNEELGPVTNWHGSWGKAADRAGLWVLTSTLCCTHHRALQRKDCFCDPWPGRDWFSSCLILFQSHHQCSLLFLSTGGKSQYWGSVSIMPNKKLNSHLPFISISGHPRSTETESLKISVAHGGVYRTEMWQGSQPAVGTWARHFPGPMLYPPLNLGGLPGCHTYSCCDANTRGSPDTLCYLQ